MHPAISYVPAGVIVGIMKKGEGWAYLRRERAPLVTENQAARGGFSTNGRWESNSRLELGKLRPAIERRPQ